MGRRIVIDYDPVADAAFVLFDRDTLGPIGRTKVLGGSWRSGYAADYDEQGNLTALDLNAVSKGVDTDLLPHATEVAEALRKAGLPVTPGRLGELKPTRIRWTDERIHYMQKVGLPLPPHVKRRIKKTALRPSP